MRYIPRLSTHVRNYFRGKQHIIIQNILLFSRDLRFPFPLLSRPIPVRDLTEVSGRVKMYFINIQGVFMFDVENRWKRRLQQDSAGPFVIQIRKKGFKISTVAIIQQLPAQRVQRVGDPKEGEGLRTAVQ